MKVSGNISRPVVYRQSGNLKAGETILLVHLLSLTPGLGSRDAYTSKNDVNISYMIQTNI